MELFGLSTDQLIIIVTALLAVSEGLSLIPSVKSNGVFQFIVNLLKKIAGKKDEQGN